MHSREFGQSTLSMCLQLCPAWTRHSDVAMGPNGVAHYVCIWWAALRSRKLDNVHLCPDLVVLFSGHLAHAYASKDLWGFGAGGVAMFPPHQQNLSACVFTGRLSEEGERKPRHG